MIFFNNFLILKETHRPPYIIHFWVSILLLCFVCSLLLYKMSRARGMQDFLRSACLYMAVIKLFVVFFQLTLTLPRVFTRLSLRKDILSRTIYFETANLSFFDGCAAHIYGIFPAKAVPHLFLLRPYRQNFTKVCRYFLIRLQNFPLLQPVRHTRTAWQTKAELKRRRSSSGGEAQAAAEFYPLPKKDFYVKYGAWRKVFAPCAI